MIRTQLIPLPRMNPLNPSSLNIRTKLLHTPLYCFASPVRGCTCLFEPVEKSADRTEEHALRARTTSGDNDSLDNLQPLQRTDDRPRGSASDAARDEIRRNLRAQKRCGGLRRL